MQKHSVEFKLNIWKIQIVNEESDLAVGLYDTFKAYIWHCLPPDRTWLKLKWPEGQIIVGEGVTYSKRWTNNETLVDI